jgi:UDPglucose 6-dehydrogenase
MNVAVLGLWHLGSVTAACLARAGHDVAAWDPDPAVVARLAEGRAPIAEPGLDDLLARGLAAGRLRFTAAVADAVGGADVIWIAFDTPVDDEDCADVEAVMVHVGAALPHVKDGALMVSSSQLPVGSVARIERQFAALSTGRTVGFACAPENLRLGKAIQVFTQPDRIVAGVRNERDRARFAALMSQITDRVIWMSVESAEMTKHAINAFLATSVAFINELAALCEAVGADAKDVERGLKSDQRIGPGAYLSPGAAFAGGTLARDLALIETRAQSLGVSTPIVRGVRQSNREHAQWTHRTLGQMLAPVAGRRISVWGLTYKPGTDTLRRSLSVELCRQLAKEGATVTAFDPAVRSLPEDLRGILTLAGDALTAAAGAEAIVIGTEWPMLREIPADRLVPAMARPIVIDPNRFLAGTLGADPRIHYVAVGTPKT